MAASAVVAVAVLAGCGVLSSLIDTQRALTNAGYSSVSVVPSVSGAAGDSLKVSVSVAAPPSSADERQVASLVWTNFHEHFQNLDITVHGTGSTARVTYSFQALVAALGARNPAYDRSSITSSTEHLGLLILGIGFAVVLVIIAVIAFFVVRRNRRRQNPYGGGPSWPGPGAGWGPGGSPPPGPGWSSPPGSAGPGWGPPETEGGWGRPAG